MSIIKHLFGFVNYFSLQRKKLKSVCYNKNFKNIAFDYSRNFTTMTVEDENGNPMGKKYKTMTVSYEDETGNMVHLLIDEGSPYADSGVEVTTGYSKDTFLFLPNEDALTEEYQAMQDKGEIFISYGTETVEWAEMEHYSWEDEGVYYALSASNCSFGEDVMAQMAKEIMAE